MIITWKGTHIECHNISICPQVDQLRQQLDAEREKTKRLEDNLKEKEIEVMKHNGDSIVKSPFLYNHYTSVTNLITHSKYVIFVE